MGNLLALDNPHITIFGLDIYFYAICIMAGIIVATVCSTLLLKRRNISPDLIYILFICCIPTALICARLFYCITDGDMPIQYWFMWDDGMGHGIRNGGLSIIGGVIGGVGMGVIVCAVKRVSFLRVADCIVPTILIAQAIGRWGNFFNQEVYGHVVTNPALQWFPFAVDIYGTWHYAFFFYESVINIIGFALLFSAAWFWKKKPNGLFVFAYFLWYGIVRSVMEPLRDKSYILNGGGVPWSSVFSALMIVLGAFGIAFLLLWNYKKEGSVFGSKRGDSCCMKDFIPAYKDETPYFSKINLMGENYPPMPEEMTFAYKWAKFKQKFSKKPPEGESQGEPKEGEEEPKKEEPKEEPKEKDE